MEFNLDIIYNGIFYLKTASLKFGNFMEEVEINVNSLDINATLNFQSANNFPVSFPQ